MRGIICLLFAVQLMGQDTPPIGILRGQLLDWGATGDSGQFTIRAEDFHVHRCRFDQQTYFEKKGARITPGSVQVNDLVEFVADRRGGEAKCYAITFYVVDRKPARKPLSLHLNLSRSRYLLDQIAPRGNMTFAGVVLRFDAEQMLLRTRSKGNVRIHLREDTRYTSDGRPTDASMLKVNGRVFVRAGRSLDGEIEAYQVLWGEILTPDDFYNSH
jgi:hypothetical protein